AWLAPGFPPCLPLRLRRRGGGVCARSSPRSRAWTVLDLGGGEPRSMNRSRWLILAWTLAHFRARGQDTRRQRQLAAAIGARAARQGPARRWAPPSPAQP